MDSITVEVKAGLNFEEVSTKPMEITQEDIDNEKDEAETDVVVEEVTETEEDKGEEAVEESKDEGEVADAK